MDTVSRPIRILLVDDHAMFRSGTRMLLEAESDFRVCGEAGDAATAWTEIQASTPDVVCLDLNLPGGGALLLVTQVRKAALPVRFLTVSQHSDITFVRAALAAGCQGYIPKASTAVELVRAVRMVFVGEQYLPLEPGTEPSPGPTYKDLSARESHVLRRLAEGFTNQQIADQLTLSVKTIESYRLRLYQKMGFTSRADLVRFALEMGLLKPENTG